MMNARFHVFGVVGEYLEYIGWTERPLADEKNIFLDIIRHGGREISDWFEHTSQCRKIEVFEIESMLTKEEAKHCVEFWRQYYSMVGAKIITSLF